MRTTRSLSSATSAGLCWCLANDRKGEAHLLSPSQIVELEKWSGPETLKDVESLAFVLDRTSVHPGDDIARLEPHSPKPLDVPDPYEPKADEALLLEHRTNFNILKESTEPSFDNLDDVGSMQFGDRGCYRLRWRARLGWRLRGNRRTRGGP